MTSPASHNTEVHGDSKKATVNGLAVVGFIGLVIAGMLLAIYAARFVPDALSRLSGAVILSDEDEPTATTTPIGTTNNEEETPVTPRPVTPTTPTTPVTPSTPSTGGPYIVTTPTYTVPRPQLYGLPDLSFSHVEVGYMRGSTFVRDNEVPRGRDAAVRFTVRNSGTNIAASGWRLVLDVENDASGVYYGPSLNPNGTKTITARITDPDGGRDDELEIELEVDTNDHINESNERNNDRSVSIDIED